jgi:hypothetical protein
VYTFLAPLYICLNSAQTNQSLSKLFSCHVTVSGCRASFSPVMLWSVCIYAGLISALWFAYSLYPLYICLHSAQTNQSLSKLFSCHVTVSGCRASFSPVMLWSVCIYAGLISALWFAYSLYPPVYLPAFCTDKPITVEVIFMSRDSFRMQSVLQSSDAVVRVYICWADLSPLVRL